MNNLHQYSNTASLQEDKTAQRQRLLDKLKNVAESVPSIIEEMDSDNSGTEFNYKDCTFTFGGFEVRADGQGKETLKNVLRMFLESFSDIEREIIEDEKSIGFDYNDLKVCFGGCEL